MELTDLEQRVRLLEKQVESTVALFQQTKLDLVSAVDNLKIEVETLKVFIKRLHPEFEQAYSEIREEVVRQVDPEWDGRHGSEK